MNRVCDCLTVAALLWPFLLLALVLLFSSCATRPTTVFDEHGFWKPANEAALIARALAADRQP